MKTKITNPKVFISYAWSGTEYESKVIAFATELMSSGVDAILDKWNLEAGNDTYAFMEQCVNDTTVTNVIMLLNEDYASKANERKGGVGAETQIISSEVYCKTTQTKFIPVVFERGSNGEVHKPTYLKNAFHFDLSEADNYQNEFQRLVRCLYGIKIYPKPQLGKTPDWVEKPTVVSVAKKISYEALNKTSNNKQQLKLIKQYLDDIKNEIVDFDTSTISTTNGSAIDPISYIEKYNETKKIRDNYIELISHASVVDMIDEKIVSFFESTENALDKLTNSEINIDIKFILLHEMFLYTIAHLIKDEEYVIINKILSASYFDLEAYSSKAKSFVEIIYKPSFMRQTDLNICVQTRDNEKYYSGTAQLWIENINTNYTKEEFVLADEFLYNYVVFAKDFTRSKSWFPTTYVYSNADASISFKQLAKQLRSKTRAQKIITLFGYNHIGEFHIKCSSVLKNNNSDYTTRYQFSFSDASYLLDFIQPDEIGTSN